MLARDLDGLVHGTTVAATGVVMSTSTHLGEGKTASIVYTACVIQVDRWFPEGAAADSSITVDLVGGRVKPRGPHQGINVQFLDKDVESFVADVEAAFKRRTRASACPTWWRSPGGRAALPIG